MKNLIVPFLIICLFGCQTTKKQNSQTVQPTKIAIQNITSYLEKRNNEEKFNGTILIAENKKIVLKKSFGFQNDKKKTANEIDTRYGLASIGKMFTAVSIMQLKEKQLLDLNQTIDDILPDYPNEKVRKKVTIKNLLNHSSGLGDFFTKEFFEQPKGSIKTLEDYLPFFVNDSLIFQPGKKFSYSNAGYIVLGLMIEKLSGEEYEEYVERNILKPLDMNSTNNPSGSAGGGNSTVSDLHKFALALKGNKLISENSLNQMKIDDLKNEYGLGLSLRNIQETKIYGHGGSTPDVSGEVEIVENSPLIIITLSNRGPADGLVQVNMYIRNEFFGKSPEIERFLNTEQVIEIFDKNGFQSAFGKLNELEGNISQRLAFHYANQYLGQEKFQKAIDIFRLILVAYPNDWNVYDSLADSYLKNGNKEQAILSYKKSLGINPDNENAIEKLKAMEKN